MNTGVKTIVYPVKDLDRAKETYAALLGAPHTDTPYYVGYRVGDQEIGLDPNGHAKGMTGPVSYWSVDDIRAVLGALAATGAVPGEPTDVGGGRLLATATDADDNVIGLVQG